MNYAFALTTFTVSLTLIIILWFCAFASLRADAFRFDVRVLRDELFDFVWKNNLSYEDPAYRTARHMLNGIIHLSAVSTPLGILAMLFVGAFSKQQPSVQRPQTSNPILAEKIKEIEFKAVSRLLNFLLLEGMFGLFGRMVVSVCRLLSASYSATNETVRAAAVHIADRADRLPLGYSSRLWPFGSHNHAASA